MRACVLYVSSCVLLINVMHVCVYIMYVYFLWVVITEMRKRACHTVSLSFSVSHSRARARAHVLCCYKSNAFCNVECVRVRGGAVVHQNWQQCARFYHIC